ncbi:hypothetical protein NDU88_006801 [Pleurodeles waltl]|uniref:Uncharacterized protein n=1 Tax=Pleurodeles waltl TaxID=8319 RepID=A0AAV7RP34_PLEWA|nr:hypothetical protein NDU88_006801 [Pleurodeles waltl]
MQRPRKYYSKMNDSENSCSVNSPVLFVKDLFIKDAASMYTACPNASMRDERSDSTAYIDKLADTYETVHHKSGFAIYEMIDVMRNTGVVAKRLGFVNGVVTNVTLPTFIEPRWWSWNPVTFCEIR